MRSGFMHLQKKPQIVNEIDITVAEIFDTLRRPLALPRQPESDLDRSMWSVISFDELEAGGLTYRQAAEVLTELELHGIRGLCIITDEAAKKTLH